MGYLGHLRYCIRSGLHNRRLVYLSNGKRTMEKTDFKINLKPKKEGIGGPLFLLNIGDLIKLAEE